MANFPKEQHFVITTDESNGNKHYDYTYKLDRPIYINPSSKYEICLVRWHLYLSHYNISQELGNNKLIIVDAGLVEHVGIVPDGHYNLVLLQGIIGSLLQSFGQPNDALVLAPFQARSSVIVVATGGLAIKFDSTNYKLGEMLGFPQGTFGTGSEGTLGVKFLDQEAVILRCNLVDSGHTNGHHYSDILHVGQIGGDVGHQMFLRSENERFYVPLKHAREINSINLKVVDENEEIIKMNKPMVYFLHLREQKANSYI